MPLPIGSFTGRIAKGGRRSIPLDRSRPLSRRSGCFPAWPYPPLSSGENVLRLRKAGVFAAVTVEYSAECASRSRDFPEVVFHHGRIRIKAGGRAINLQTSSRASMVEQNQTRVEYRSIGISSTSR